MKSPVNTNKSTTKINTNKVVKEKKFLTPISTYKGSTRQSTRIDTTLETKAAL